MAISLDTIENLYILLQDRSLKNRTLLLVGDHGVGFDKIPSKLIKRWGLSQQVNGHHTDQRGHIRLILLEMGYEQIYFLDNFNDDSLDYQLNLSEANSTGPIMEKFGVVVDNGTSIYAMQIFNAIWNVSQLPAIGGYLITNLDPSSFNRFPFLPAPETLLDIMACRGFECVEISMVFMRERGLSKRRRYALSYKHKQYTLFQCLSFFELLMYLRWVILSWIFMERIDEGALTPSLYVHYKKTDFQIPSFSRPSIVQKRLSSLRSLALRLLRCYLGLEPGRGRVIIEFIFRKVNHSTNMLLNDSTLHYEIKWRDSRTRRNIAA